MNQPTLVNGSDAGEGRGLTEECIHLTVVGSRPQMAFLTDCQVEDKRKTDFLFEDCEYDLFIILAINKSI